MTCELPVYKRKEVIQSAKILAKTVLKPTKEFTQNYLKFYPEGASVLLSFVYCKTGEITDIQIIKGLLFGMDERLIESVRGIKFIPAQKDGQTISLQQKIEISVKLY